MTTKWSRWGFPSPQQLPSEIYHFFIYVLIFHEFQLLSSYCYFKPIDTNLYFICNLLILYAICVSTCLFSWKNWKKGLIKEIQSCKELFMNYYRDSSYWIYVVYDSKKKWSWITISMTLLRLYILDFILPPQVGW